MSTIRVVNIQHSDATEPNIVLNADGTATFVSGITISGGTNLTVSGTAEFASGTVSAPGITFIDDNNTGIYEPAADTVAITTAATERLRIDSSGRLLVGTTSGSYDFEVKKSGHIHGLIGSTNAAGATLLLDGDSNGDGAGSDYASLSHNSDGNLILENRKTASIIFRNTSSSTERMRINSSGNVGIGNTAPGAKLQIEGTSDQLKLTYTSIASYIHEVDSNGDYSIAKDSSERLRIDSLGRLLVGTSTTGGASTYYDDLVISNTDSGTGCGITLLANATNGFNAIDFGDTDAAGRGRITYSHADDSLRIDTAGAERMRIDSSGNVEVKSGAEFRVYRSDNTRFGSLYTNGFATILEASQSPADPLRLTSADRIEFYAGSNERMRISSAGLLELGKTTGQAFSGDGLMMNPGTAPFYSAHKSLTGNQNGLLFYHSGTYVGGLNYSDTATTLVASSDYRLKENVVSIPNALSRAKQLNPVQFNFISNPSEITEGFLAHEVGEVVPLACFGEKDAVDENGNIKPQSLSQVSLIPLLTAALKEAIAKIETLEVEVAALKAQ